MSDDPYMVAWRDQFVALMRDKVLQMIEALKVTGWTQISHEFDDPFDDDEYRLIFSDGSFVLLNMTANHAMLVDVSKLGIDL